MQQGMLFHSTYAADSGVYIEQFQLTLEATVNLDALKQAWQQLIDTYDVLRTCFVLQRSQPLQVVLKQVTLPWQGYDWQSLSAEEQQQQLPIWLHRDRQAGFDVTKAPLMRFALIQLNSHQYQFIWTHHHALLDGWSIPILMQDLLQRYGSLLQERPLPAVQSSPYQDYVAWLQQQDKAPGIAYWQQQLAGFEAPTALPWQAAHRLHHPHTLETGCHEQRHSLSAELTASLQHWLRKHRLSLATLIYGIWGSLLSRYSGESDVVFGVTVSGRSVPLTGIETMVGLFINTLPLRVRSPLSQAILPLLRQLQLDFQDLQTYSYLSLVELQGLSQLSSQDPLFNSLVVVENYPVDQALLDDQTVLPIQTVTVSEHANYPLTLLIGPGEHLSLRFLYSPDCFTGEAIAQMAGHFETLLRGVLEANDPVAIAQLPVLTPPEHQQVVVSWNNTAAEYPQTACLHQLVEAQVAHTPDAIAVLFEAQKLIYRELNTRANQLAHHLQKRGVGPEVLVGICVERSLEMVIGLLAILKAGGAYVPLDPSYPAARIRFMLQDAQVWGLLSQHHLPEQLADWCPEGAQLLCLDRDWSMVAQEPTENLTTTVTLDNLAYVIYTSGSTGQPKGVAMSQRPLLNLLHWQKTHSGASSGKTLQFTPLSFDVSFQEIFSTLSSGGCLCLIHDGQRQDAFALLKILQETSAERLFLPFVALQNLAEAADQSEQRLSSLKEVFTAGEQLKISPAIRRWFARIPACRLHNQYGPTESHVVSAYVLDHSTRDWEPLPPIGQAISNTKLYVLDSHQHPVPVGIPGELHIGGAGLARGYLNQPKLTAAKFIVNPFGPGRLYRTGDLVRFRPDGNLAFLGRIDHQVKLRGFRIELGEIEAVLSCQVAVKQCAVLVTERMPGNPQLVAYVVMDAEQASIRISDLKQALQSELPNYMMPSVIMPLDTLPLTPSGKVDRRALPAPSREELMADQAYIEPQNDWQRLIAQQFAETLSLPPERVGLQASFFDLGGHSLLATQLVSRLRQAFEIEVPLRTLFESPTVAELEQALRALIKEGNPAVGQTPPIMPLPANLRDPSALPVSFAQQRLWFLTQLEGNSAAYNIPGAVRIDGPLNITALQQALDALVSRHESLRTCFPLRDGHVVQCVAPTSDLSLAVIAATELDRRLPDWLIQQAQRPFDLETGPLLRVQLIQIAPTQQTLLVVMHHIISDGWSMGVFIREILALYHSYQTGQPITLPPLPIQYADYSAWQRQWLQGEVLEQQVRYWQQQLAGAPALLELPTDHPRPAVQSFQGRTYQATLPSTLTAEVKRLAQQQGVTLFMVLLSAFQLLLARYSGQQDIAVGSPIANRQHAELESLIGFFVNTLVLRMTLDTTSTVADLLQQVRRVALEAYAHQDVPFEQIVEALPFQRTLAYAPLFQVMFILQNAPTAPLELDNISLAPLEVNTGTAKFDLTLEMQETPQGVVGRWEYNSDLFEASTIARMASHFEILLEAMVTDVQQLITTLPLLPPHERQQLLVDWNATAADYSTDECIHELFEQQAALTPERVAVVCVSESLSYDTLNARANQLAHRLQSLGVGPEILVGLCIERSIDMLVGLLGILKAGGAYVPLDPSYPKERLHYMLEDTQVSVLVTQKTIAANLPAHEAQQIYIDADWDSHIRFNATHNPTSGVTPENLAYVLYTSGSTGKPKGVQGIHRGTINRLRWMWMRYPFQGHERCCQKTSVSFVDSVWEFFGGLLRGIPTLIIPSEVVKDPHRLIQTLSVNQVSRIVLVPSLLKAILDTDEELSFQLSHLKYWITSGEAIETHLCQKFCDLLPDASLINLYGSSEVSADVTYYEIHQKNPPHLEQVLPFNGLENASPADNITSPQALEEEVLVEIWKKVLKLKKTGTDANFFELGGNDFLAAQVISYVREILDVSLPKEILQEAPSIRRLAARLKDYETEPGKAATISRLLKQLQMPSKVNV